MIVLGKYKFLLHLNGLNAHGGPKNIVARIVYSFLFLLFTLSTVTYLVLNIRLNFDRTLPSLCITLALFAFMPTYFHVLLNRGELYALLDDLEDIVDERKYLK